MASDKINVAVVDDHTLFRKAVIDFLMQQEDITVTIQGANTPELVGKLKDSRIDVLVMDLFMPQSDINETIEMIRREYGQVRILILSMCTDMAVISEVMNMGIHGYISKNDEPEELLRSIRTVYENKIFRNNIFTEALYWNSEPYKKTFARVAEASFDDREKKILQLLWNEKSNKEIAEELFLSIRSVEKIRQDMKEKSGAKSTVGLFKYALGKKIIAFNYSGMDAG